MYNVDKLERQWIRYRRKKMILPIAVALLGLSAVAAVLYLGTGKEIVDHNQSVNPSVENSADSFSSVNKKKVVSKEKIGKLDVLATEVPSLSPIQNPDRPKAGQIIFQDTSRSIGTKIKKRKNILIQVTERGGKDIAVDIENRFEFAKDKSDSLFLAKYYYDKMEYAKAEKWALETNKLDSSIEESWLIFAKSLAKQGKRIESLKVLRAFLKQKSSADARTLMDKIRRGKKF